VTDSNRPDRPRRGGDNSRRPGRPGGSGSGSDKPGSGRPSGGRPSGGRPSGGRPSSGRPGADRAGSSRGGRPDRGDQPDRAGRPDRGAGPDRGGRGGKPGDVRPGKPRPPRDDQADAPVFPAILPDVAPDQLDRQARRELSGLDKADAEFVAKHLVMASIVIDDDPALAHEHAKAALHKGSRIPVVRESVGITAYLVGDFALALRELRTYRRLAGTNASLPMMIDCERGLGRPERGIELARGVDRTELGDQWAVELAIALSGCRLDLGQTEQALIELQIPQLQPDVAFSYSPDLFDAYAVVLEDLGRADEAALWGERATRAARALSDKQWSEKDNVGDIVDALDGVEEDEVVEHVSPVAQVEETAVVDQAPDAAVVEPDEATDTPSSEGA
jgi:hypothetical protein